MDDAEVPERDLRRLLVPDVGRLLETDDPWEPYRLEDGLGRRVEPAQVFLLDLLAAGRPPTTLRSYGHDLLRWWRFLAAVGVTDWDRAVREDARDFMLWMQLADKPVRVHWRYRDREAANLPVAIRKKDGPAPGTPNPVTGKPTLGAKFAATTRAHCETVLRSFYDFHLERTSGSLLLNPFPLARVRKGSRANAHHNPEADYRRERSGRYRPAVRQRPPRRIPDEKYTEIFAGLRSNRDRALLASWVSTGARCEELLTARECDAVPAQQTIGVIRKGTGAYQELPASPDAFVWLRLSQEAAWHRGVPKGRNEPLWWTLRRPWRPLTYHAARAMFVRVMEVLGTNWTLHDLRHTAAYRMANDPQMSLVYVQQILGHRFLATTQIYVSASQDEVVAAGLAHQQRVAEGQRNVRVAAPAYDVDSLSVLLPGAPW